MGKQTALVVGVSNYPTLSWALPGVANDAREMAALLGSAQGQFRGGDILVLADAQAAAAAITSALDAVLGGAAADDTVFVYIAGHGVCRDGTYYFVAHDTMLGCLADTAVPLTAIKERFEKSASRRVFVWLDFCHSGGIIERAVGGDSAEAAREVIERTIQVVGRGKIIVTACTGSQTAKESNTLGHGYFTHALLEGLKGAAADAKGRVLATTLYNHVVDRVQAESHDQCPVWHGQMEGHIVLMHHDPRALAGQATGGGPGPGVGVCESSGDWVMLGDLFLPSVSVSVQADRIVIEIRPRTTQENAAIQRLRPSHGRGEPIPFAHGDEGLLARVTDVSSKSQGGNQLVTITLAPEKVQYGGGGMEMNVQGVTADELAERRAGRLLLNDPPALKSKSSQHTEAAFVESYVRGSSTRYPVDRAVLQEIHAAYQGQPELVLPLARLKLLFALRASDCVEEISVLRLGPVQAGKCRVLFEGRRARKYSNVEPHAIKVEGDCPLA